MSEARSEPDTLDQRIDAALARRFALPSGLETLAARSLPARHESGLPSRAHRFAPWIAVALAVAASVVVFLWVSRPASSESERSVETVARLATPRHSSVPNFCRLVGPLQEGQPEPGRLHSPDLERLYLDMDACQSDTSAATCGTSDFLAERMSATYGQPIALRPEAAGRLHGPFGSDQWPTATIVIGTSDERTAILVADRDATLACCVRMQLPADSGLQIFTLQVGEVVLTEISPLSEPRLLPYFQ